MSQSYTASSIEVLSGLDPVRKRPGMYTDTSTPNHLAQEVIDNSVDEALAGHANEIEVILHADGSLSVKDNGRGMPTDIHPEQGVPGVEVILSTLHAGGKFSADSYQFSGGLHGVGVSVVNALSYRLEVTIQRDGKVQQMAFEGGEKASELLQIDKCAKKATGTQLRFWPDAQYFDNSQFALKTLLRNLRAKAVLCSGLSIRFYHEATDETHSWLYEAGLSDYFAECVDLSDSLLEAPFLFSQQSDEYQVDGVATWLAEHKTVMSESYVNLIPTAQGGTHVNGFRSGLLEAVKEYAEHRKLLPKNVRLTADDVSEHLSFVLSFKMNEPQFAGQIKERLSSKVAATQVQLVLKNSFSLFLNQNAQQADALVELVVAQAQARQKNAKKVVRKKVTSGPALPGKLVDCVSQDVSQTELFLVEGDSAGGSAKQARDRMFQAIMPLRGKILNSWEVDADQVLGSQEIHDISVAIGLDPHSTDLSQLRYGKVCVLADADSDGAHIATLICALFYKHFPALVEAGHLYIAMPPLFRVDVGKVVEYAIDESEKAAILAKYEGKNKAGKIQVTRFKGLGEMNPQQLKETTMDVLHRRLIQLTVPDAEPATELMDMLLAKKRAADRKAWLQEKGNLAVI